MDELKNDFFLKLNHEINKKDRKAQQYAKLIKIREKEYQKLKQENINLENNILKKTKKKKSLEPYRLTMKIEGQNQKKQYVI